MVFLWVFLRPEKIQALQSSFVTLRVCVFTFSVFSIDSGTNAIDEFGGTESVKLENLTKFEKYFQCYFFRRL